MGLSLRRTCRSNDQMRVYRWTDAERHLSRPKVMRPLDLRDSVHIVHVKEPQKHYAEHRKLRRIVEPYT
jgi:hypothetical protein